MTFSRKVLFLHSFLCEKNKNEGILLLELC
nr:MAG TPA: hypothetical protein [Caudoviricetes sp.]